MLKGIFLFAALMPALAAADAVVPIDEVENSVNIRMSPDAASEVVGKLDQGSSAEVVDSIDGWHEVRIEGGATGFISSDWTTLVSEDARIESPVESDVDDSAAEVAVEEASDTVVNEASDMLEKSVTNVVEAVVDEEIVEEVIREDGETPVAINEEIVSAVEELATEEPRQEVVVDAVNLKGTRDYVIKFRNDSRGVNSQIFDDGNQVGIGTTTPKQRLEVNGSIQIHEQNSGVAGLMITQSSGDTGYIMHNRASTLTIGAGSQDRITIDRDGNVGIAVSRPDHPLEMASGAHATAGGVWTNSSSRAKKENIAALDVDAATETLMQLQPVTFNYRNEVDEDYVGFIAEDVPDLVAVAARDALSTMDIVAVLTRVVQEQQNKIAALEARLDER